MIKYKWNTHSTVAQLPGRLNRTAQWSEVGYRESHLHPIAHSAKILHVNVLRECSLLVDEDELGKKGCADSAMVPSTTGREDISCTCIVALSFSISFPLDYHIKIWVSCRCHIEPRKVDMIAALTKFPNWCRWCARCFFFPHSCI